MMNKNTGIMQGKKILIIDDDYGLCQSIKMNFSKAGALVYTATDGRTGLQRFQEQQPDVVILDIHMPFMDGWETCHLIRLSSKTPIIMLTGLNQEQEVARAIAIGANDFISKPFSREILNARVEQVLDRPQTIFPPILDLQPALWRMATV